MKTGVRTGFDRDVFFDGPWLCWEIWPLRFRWKTGPAPNFALRYAGHDLVLTGADCLDAAGRIAEGFALGWQLAAYGPDEFARRRHGPDARRPEVPLDLSAN